MLKLHESRKMNEPVHTLRLATPDDAEALLKIYEPLYCHHGHQRDPGARAWRIPPAHPRARWGVSLHRVRGRWASGGLCLWQPSVQPRGVCVVGGTFGVFFDRPSRRGLGRARFTASCSTCLRCRVCERLWARSCARTRKATICTKKMGFELVGTLRAASWKLGRGTTCTCGEAYRRR